MLYVTTRNQLDALTAHHVLTHSSDTNGGLFVPLHFPKLSEQDRKKFMALSTGQCIAEILNLFFSAKLTSWDVDFSIGRYPVRLEPLGHRICMAETWHNPDLYYHRLERNLMELLHADSNTPGSWTPIAIRMAILAGILGNYEILGTGPVDIAVVSGDFTLPISAWYLREMGFPVGNIICCCNENNQFWNLICNGQMHTADSTLSSVVPEADITIPVNLERLISECGGPSETKRYLDCCQTGSSYFVSDGMLQQLRKGLYVSVISSNRVETTIPNVYNTHGYIMSPAAALAYSGLLDYRAKTGIARTAIVLCDKNPIYDGEIVAKAMEISMEELKRII